MCVYVFVLVRCGVVHRRLLPLFTTKHACEYESNVGGASVIKYLCREGLAGDDEEGCPGLQVSQRGCQVGPVNLRQRQGRGKMGEG